MNQDNPFYLLHQSMQRFVVRKGWHDLNSIQKKSIVPILEHKLDCVISAATASGKTEAAFLPALSYILNNKKDGIRILYISPLKALINDQYRRLLDMCNGLELAITPWHGDISHYKKNQQFTDPKGVILVTPESLESILINHTKFATRAFAALDYVIIDEFHAFISGERGAQLMSQIHRIENLIGHTIVRIALSATFSNFKDVAAKVRPHHPSQVLHIEPDNDEASSLAIKIYGYDRKVQEINQNNEIDLEKTDLKTLEKDLQSSFNMSSDIFRLMRGQVNLVFTNSRSECEVLASILTKMSEDRHVPNEFFPHHGSLAKDLREDVEDRLIKGQFPTTAICTSTLELGIDISEVNTIGQIGAPFTVASLRQRIGRSGRRDGKATLRMFEAEMPSDFNLSSAICEKTITSMAMVELLLNRWYEPPNTKSLYASTLVQQTLSVISSLEHVTAKGLYQLLCKTGPFYQINPKLFGMILKSLGKRDIIMQLGDGSLTLGLEGEKVVSDWGFYAAFNTVPEFRIVNNGKTIGTTPFTGLISSMNYFLLAGRGWEIEDIDYVRKVIQVRRYDHNCDPLPSISCENPMHEKIREKMHEIYLRDDLPAYLNKVAKVHLQHARQNFLNLGLDKKRVIETNKGIAIFPWSNNDILRSLRLLFHTEHIRAEIIESHLEIEYISKESLGIAIVAILNKAKDYSPHDLLSNYRNIELEKFTAYLDNEVKEINYLHDQCDIEGALKFLKSIIKELK